jgi:hypothetical protein
MSKKPEPEVVMTISQRAAAARAAIAEADALRAAAVADLASVDADENAELRQGIDALLSPTGKSWEKLYAAEIKKLIDAAVKLATSGARTATAAPAASGTPKARTPAGKRPPGYPSYVLEDEDGNPKEWHGIGNPAGKKWLKLVPAPTSNKPNATTIDKKAAEQYAYDGARHKPFFDKLNADWHAKNPDYVAKPNTKGVKLEAPEVAE